MTHKVSVSVQPGYLLLVAIGIMILPLKLIIAWIFASFIHELGHIICIMLMKKQIYTISFGASGAIMETEQLENGQELLAALSGPLAGMLLLPLTHYIPLTAMLALAQSLYNLIPIYPMDGGRVIFGLVTHVWGADRGKKIYRIFVYSISVIILIAVVYATIRFSLGLVPLVLLLFLYVRIKSSCKEWS